MATALAATYQAGTGTDPDRVLLAVTGAPSVTPNYTSNFATVDGWTGSSGTGLLPTAGALQLQGDIITTSTFSRTVTGLTSGETYRFTGYALALRGTIAIGVSGMTFSAFTYAATRSPMEYTFVATATSHTIQFKVAAPPVPAGTFTNGVYNVDTVKVTRTSGWQGTTIRRTDANGTSVKVRTDRWQDTTGTTGSATMNVTDYELALVPSVVSYTVTDGNGVTATATVTPPATAGVWLALPATANPATPTPPRYIKAALVTGFRESSPSNGSVHVIIGRADPIVNPGPLGTRTGQVKVWCADYATAKAVRALLAGGDTAHLRQPTYAGMDCYLVARRVDIEPQELTAAQTWAATVEFQEVAAP